MNRAQRAQDGARRRTHRALANDNRLRLMRLLQDSAQDVTALSAATGLHPNTVRAHLDVLMDAGLVIREQQAADGPGRPPRLYRIATPPPDSPPPDSPPPDGGPLARVLVDALRRAAVQPAEAAEAAGWAWGRQAVPGGAALGPDQTVDRIAVKLEEQGFAPTIRRSQPGRTQLLLHACPYADLAEQDGDVVCAIHLGALRGTLDAFGNSMDVDLRPFAEPGLCVADLDISAHAG